MKEKWDLMQLFHICELMKTMWLAHPLSQILPVSAATNARMTISNFGKSFKNMHFLINVQTGLSAPNDPNNNMYTEHVYGKHFRLHSWA